MHRTDSSPTTNWQYIESQLSNAFSQQANEQTTANTNENKEQIGNNQRERKGKREAE